MKEISDNLSNNFYQFFLCILKGTVIRSIFPQIKCVISFNLWSQDQLWKIFHTVRSTWFVSIAYHFKWFIFKSLGIPFCKHPSVLSPQSCYVVLLHIVPIFYQLHFHSKWFIGIRKIHHFEIYHLNSFSQCQISEKW